MKHSILKVVAFIAGVFLVGCQVVHIRLHQVSQDVGRDLVHGKYISALAEGYGMHTLADMARCFRAAWEEGDIESAAQIVEEMRVEASRDGKIV